MVARLLKESAARPRTGSRRRTATTHGCAPIWTIGLRTQHYGNQHFPRAAGKSLYGSVQVHVTLDAQGRLLRSAISRGDPDPRLNAAVMRMLHRAAPFPRFPAALAADYDALEIVRTLSFTHEHDPKP
ncbi:MAG: energy transducer TonB [Uliginosibacterium sp.]|nr:energy transducer TonB [Uliginosibacterium sp.]